MGPNLLAMLDRPPTPPADSPFSSFSNSSNSNTSEDTNPSRSSRLVSSTAKSKNTTLPPRSSEHKVADSRQLYTAQKLVSQLRQYEGGVDIRPEYPLGVQEFKKLEAYINQLPETDSLIGFWYDKLRYEYDSDTQLFRILMTTWIHERIISLISEQVNDWLKELRRHNSPVIKEFASAITEERSTRIVYSSHEERMTVEEALGSSTSSEPEPTPSPSTKSCQPAATQRRTSVIVTRSHNVDEGQVSVPTNQTQQQELRSSDTRNSDAKEKRYNPDNSWRFISPQFEDERAAFVLEVAKTQPMKDLYNKVEGLLGPCEATAVLACRTDIPKSGRATLELWSRDESDDTQQTSGSPDLIWSRDILNEEGEVPDDQSFPPIRFDLFIAPDSWNRFFNQYTDDEAELFDSLAPLKINTSVLGYQLKELRNKNRKGDRNPDGIHEEHKIEPDRKRKFHERRQASRKSMKTAHRR